MNKTAQIRIGVAPVRRHGFPQKDAEESRRQIQDFFKSRGEDPSVEFVHVGNHVPDGMLHTAEDVRKAAELFSDKAVDALFIPHCDFGEESVVAGIAKEVKKPVLIWGPRDEGPDPATGIRKRDTQCGIFASTKVLSRYGIPFSYIVNSDINDPIFAAGLDQFCRSASVVKTFERIRIAQVSTRPKPFYSVMANEAELLERFGIEIVPVNVPDLTAEIDRAKKDKSDQVAAIVEQTKTRMSTDGTTPEQIENLAALHVGLLSIIQERECNAAAIECWSMLLKNLGVMPCLVVGELSDLGIPVACETDVHGAVSSLILQAAGMNDSPTFFADLTIRHPDNDNAELLWHCGPFPYSLKDPDSDAAVENGTGQWSLKNGDITIARFDALRGSYSLFAGEAHTTQGPKTTGTSVWIEVDNWEAWEKKFIYGPYIHHVTGMYGSYAGVLSEACRFIDGLAFDTV